MSPQMLRGFRFRTLLKSMDFKDLVRWMLIDEAHLVDETSGTFLEAYRSIRSMRALLHSNTVWASVTGTATPSRALAIAAGLGYQPGHYVNARYSIDRPNIKYITRFLHHPVSSGEYLDLSFLIPLEMTSVDEIESTLIFCTTIQRGNSIMQYLDGLIPPDFPNRLGVVKLYNSIMSSDYRHDFLRDIEDGSNLRIGIVTDTCTYGLDVRNLRRVVLFDLPPSPENQKQKIGRPGRDNLPAKAITFAPSWVQDIPESEIKGVPSQGKADAKRRAKLPLIIQQWHNPTSDLCPRAADLRYNEEMFLLRENCCSTHDFCGQADLHMVERWEAHFTKDSRITTLRSDATYRALEKPMKDSLVHMLDRWRYQKWAQLRGQRRGLPCDHFLPRYIMLRVVEKAHICSTLERLRVMMEGWSYIDSHGDELLKYITKIMLGFNAVFEARKGVEGSLIEDEVDEEHIPLVHHRDVPTPEHPDCILQPIVLPQTSHKSVLRILGPVPVKSSSSTKRPPPSPPRPLPKICLRRIVGDKENIRDDDEQFMHKRRRFIT